MENEEFSQKDLNPHLKRYIMYRLRIIKESYLKSAVPPKSKAGKWLEAWRMVVRAANWKSFHDVRKSYPSADPVKVESGRTVTVFDVCGTDYRLLTAIHYNKKRIYTLKLLTHADYSKNRWKKDL
jgi:mRNA interferase HigB